MICQTLQDGKVSQVSSESHVKIREKEEKFETFKKLGFHFKKYILSRVI